MNNNSTSSGGSVYGLVPKVTPECIRKALGLGHISVEYQPKYDLARRRVTGVEALARWTCPERGRIGPDAFIPVAESSGLIRTLGQAILFQSCIEFSDVRRQTGLSDLSLAVNVSGHQLRGCGLDDFVKTVSAALYEAKLPPKNLHLELTETTWCRPSDEILGQLTALAKKGIHIVVDDFGAGAAGLNRLVQLPVLGVKIDKGFVQLLDRNDNSGQTRVNPERLLSEIIRFVRSLGLSLVAEGVERLDQAIWLLEKGCPVIQGFFISTPMPKEELIDFLNAPRSPAFSLAKSKTSPDVEAPIFDGFTQPVFS